MLSNGICLELVSATPRCAEEVGERGAPRQGDVTPSLHYPTPQPHTDPELCVPGIQATHRRCSTQAAPAVITGKDVGHLLQQAPEKTGTLLAAPARTYGSEGKLKKNQDALEVHLGRDHWDCGIGKSFVLI